jgi:MerR family mercuric resistance operon transcriptional regulator
LKRVEFIKRSQALGFSLKEISEIMSLRVEPGTTCGDIKIRVETKVEDIEKKIADLKRMRMALKRMSNKCMEKEPVGQCPILEELYK